MANGRWRKNHFHLFPLFPQPILLKLSIFPFDLKVLFYYGSRPLFMRFLLFPWPINYDCIFWCHKSPPTFIINSILLKISLLFLEIMASRMVTSYGPQVAQVNEELAPESSLNLMLTQHHCDENPAPQKVHVHLEIDPPWAWYYRIFPNPRTLVILLQVNHVSSNEPETVCESYYEMKDTSIFTWSLVPNVGHYRCLHGPIRRLPPNSKAD